MIFTGGGSNFEEYSIHLVEMTVKLLHNPASRVKVEAVGNQLLCRVVSENGTQAALVYSPGASYSVVAQLQEGKYYKQNIASAFFVNLLRDIIRFFETGEHSFDPAETLEVMRVRDALLAAQKQDGQWVAV
jgi:hypothetical protein